MIRFDSNASDMQIWFDKGGSVWWKVCSRTNFIKQCQTRSFFFFSKFFEIMVYLKCIRHFIKHASLMMFDAFTPAFIFKWLNGAGKRDIYCRIWFLMVTMKLFNSKRSVVLQTDLGKTLHLKQYLLGIFWPTPTKSCFTSCEVKPIY